MKISVLGAGAVGSAIACDLVGREAVTHVQVCDNRSGRLRALAEHLRSPKLRTVRVDVRDDRALAPVLAGSACVVGSVDGALNPKLAAVALESGAHFCDLGGDSRTVAQELALAPEAKRRARWVVPNCGLAPGLVNLLVMRGVDQFEEVEGVTIRVGNIPIEAGPPFFHRFGYTAERLVEGYTAPVEIIRDGRITHVAPLTGLEEDAFPAPFGRLEAFYTAGKLSTLPQDLAGRVDCLDYKTLRHPGHAAAMQAVLALGFGVHKSVDVRTHLTYRDLLVRSLRRNLTGSDYRDAALVRIVVEGRKDGEACTLTYEMVDRYDEEAGLTAMQRSTSFPAASIAFLLASGAVAGGGASPPEHVIPKEPFFADLAAHGLSITERWDEVPEAVDA